MYYVSVEVIYKIVDYVLKDKKSIFIDKRTKIGKNVIIYENNRIEGQSVIEDNVTIFPNCFISNTSIGKGAKIYSSIIEKSNIGACCSVGPYSVIKKSEIGAFVKVGAFSEIKNSVVEHGVTVETGSLISENHKRMLHF